MKIIRNIISSKVENGLKIDLEKIPGHIAIIMDGNGRWAKKKGLPRTLGHRAGVEALRDVVRTASDIGVQYLTLFAFSTENWKRPEQEVSALMKLLIEFLKKEVSELHKNNVKINTIGDILAFPTAVQDEISKSKSLTNSNTGLCVNIALNYGSRDEITRAVQKLSIEISNNKLSIDDINEDIIKKYLDTENIPDPDLLIRTSGEYRLSNFLLWQCAYTELWFTDTYWPDFNGKHLLEAIFDFQNRQRRFGGV
ncbi:Undecaprenyl pyrophosphate synthetase [Anaerovirgula multivorans]|uniref:Isoprenyl transferase n=1 Tax=Anaerovirgula multivorans TaxID=312168 RepID=A0A239A1H0_9FIRM|nr:isoprenyl transferase [Anaerovirgula multivorans]SNR89131.1 Undecaprenyl pyrophosphate synthetase [Anaerovirgula multivorans]